MTSNEVYSITHKIHDLTGDRRVDYTSIKIIIEDDDVFVEWKGNDGKLHREFVLKIGEV